MKNHSHDLKYAGRVAGTIIVCFILEPFRWWEELRWKKRISKTKITRPPVFIIGFWRSGTTLLHNLLSQTPGSSYITTYQTVFPNLLLAHSWWFKPIIGRFWPTHRPFDDVRMGMDLPQEEEIAFANLQDISFYNFLYFPKDFDKFYEKELFMNNINEKQIQRWKSEYIKMIKKSFLNLKGDWFISKSPSNMARIKIILEMFPDARFVFIYRDPYKTNESFFRFFHEVLPAVQIQSAHEELSRERLARVYADLINEYFKTRDLIPPANLLEIRFEDFKKDPVIFLRKMFEQFGMPGFQDALPFYQKYLNDISDFNQGKYELTPETIFLVNKYAGDIVDRLGYERRSSAIIPDNLKD